MHTIVWRRRGAWVAFALTVFLAGLFVLPPQAAKRSRSGEVRPSRARVENAVPRRGPNSSPSTAPRPTAPTRRASGQAHYGHGRGVHWSYDTWYWARYTWGFPWWWGGYWGTAYGLPIYYGVADDPRIVAAHSNRPGRLVTDVAPRRARIQVDGEFVGQARDYDGRWDRLSVGAGRHTVEISAPGYLTLRRIVEVAPGEVVRLTERLERGEGEDPRSSTAATPATATEGSGSDVSSQPAAAALKPSFLRIAVQPGDAAVYLDGGFLGLAEELERLHGAIAVTSGAHRLEVTRPGYGTRVVELDVVGSEPTVVEFELERQR